MELGRYGPHLLLAFALLCNAAANILIKWSMTKGAPTEVATTLVGRAIGFLSPVYLLALLLFGLNLVAYSIALRTLKISIAYPVMVSGGFCLILIAGLFLFHERMTSMQYGGIALILTGIWMVVR